MTRDTALHDIEQLYGWPGAFGPSKAAPDDLVLAVAAEQRAHDDAGWLGEWRPSAALAERAREALAAPLWGLRALLVVTLDQAQAQAREGDLEPEETARREGRTEGLARAIALLDTQTPPR